MFFVYVCILFGCSSVDLFVWLVVRFRLVVFLFLVVCHLFGPLSGFKLAGWSFCCLDGCLTFAWFVCLFLVGCLFLVFVGCLSLSAGCMFLCLLVCLFLVRLVFVFFSFFLLS